jgi:hypothetical protein
MAIDRASFFALVSAIAASTTACGSTPTPSADGGPDAANTDGSASDAATRDAAGTDSGALEDAAGNACPPGFTLGLDGGCFVLE